ncbi:RNA polymerase sigma-70 factor (ECF subfamily) [Dysgonomonas alginatilytica]|uniref:RNA polymerase sigma-70 factor (ECF subfamily) n=1 Tax=Dysgonomonas alginatilytica TaxID=1605892 RepID=A0A2V3PSY7_9BACT|nr:RNA polymerase sigma factor [Dysgonomonas alginatilytica]PXV68139.1 RNA polymerase sigma-70 factor (ECF subfamily) [Dysgonomonas alginatilytica]
MADNDIQEQFLSILEENIGMIIKISRAYTKVVQDREDLINDITLELWKSFKHFKGGSKISTWIYRVALNTSMNYKRKKTSGSLFSYFNDLKEKDTYSWLMEEDNSPELEILYNCIDELNEINKAIILLYLDDNSHDEISEIMGISKTNVGTRISRIKEQIKNLAISKI